MRESLHEIIIQFMINGTILKINALPMVLFTDASINLIKKGLWFILCYFIIFQDKPIFDYQNTHPLYRSNWKNLDSKGLRNRYNRIIGTLSPTDCDSRTQWYMAGKVQNIFIARWLLKVLIKERMQGTE